LYDLLSPAYRRPQKFYLRGANYNPKAVGFYADAQEKGAFLFDTTLPGNSNLGHEFRAGYRPYTKSTEGTPGYGAIGPEMTDDERWAIIEYLKIRRDSDQDTEHGWPDPVCPESKYLGGDAKKLACRESGSWVSCFGGLARRL
jgi:hypothetical protein